MSISAASDGAGGGSAVGPSTRAEIQIMSEMRSHMGMHRQLLMRKELSPQDLLGKTFEFQGRFQHLPPLVVAAIEQKQAHTAPYLDKVARYAQHYAGLQAGKAVA